MRKRIATTSLMAWDDIVDTVSHRTAMVLEGLRRCRLDTGRDPTAYELLRFLQRDQPALDLNGVRPRLTELRDADRAHTTGKRRCAVTAKAAYTWAAGRSSATPMQEDLF